MQNIKFTFWLLLLMTIYAFDNQAQFNYFDVYDNKDLFNDSIDFYAFENKLNDRINYENVFRFDDEIKLKNDNVRFNTNNRLLRYGDTTVPIKYKSKSFLLHCQFMDSLKHGLWQIHSEDKKVRSEYYFNNDTCLFAVFYNENGQIIRETSFTPGEFGKLDKWYYNNQLIRFSNTTKNGRETKIFYPDGDVLLSYNYDKYGTFFKGTYWNKLTNESSHISALGYKYD